MKSRTPSVLFAHLQNVRCLRSLVYGPSPHPSRNETRLIIRHLYRALTFSRPLADPARGAELTWAPGYTPLKTLGDLIAYNKANYELEFQGGLCCRGDPAYALYYQQSWEASQLTGDKRDPSYVGAKMVRARRD